MDWKINSQGDRFAEAGADPNHDGVPLIFDYALGEGERPSMVMENGIPLLRFDRPVAHQDIVLTIQRSDDLIDWHPAANFANGGWTWDDALVEDFQTNTFGEMETVEAAYGLDETPLFLKIEAKLP